MSEFTSLLDELQKLGAVSDEHAQHALDRLDQLEKSRPTAGQLGRYGAIGAAAMPVIGAVGNVIHGKAPFKANVAGQRFGKIRDAASMAVKGGLAASVIPIARAHSDRRVEIGTLKKYVDEREPGKVAAYVPPTTDETHTQAVAGGLGVGGAWAANKGMGKLTDRANRAGYAGKEELFQKLVDESPVPVDGLEGTTGGHFNFIGKPRVAVSVHERSPGTLAHELGHAEIAAHPAGKLLQNRFTATLGARAPWLGLASGAGAGLSDDPTVRALGVAAPALAAAPELAYEAGASIAGLRRLRRAGATGKQMMHSMKSLGPAWGTYGTRAAMGTLGAYGLRGAVTHARHMRNAPDEEGKIAAVKEALPRYEREIQAGNITRGDVVPGSLNVKGGILGPAARNKTRGELAAPAAVAPEQVARRRLLNEKLYHAQTNASPGALGVDANITREAHPQMVAATMPGIFGPPTVHAPPVAGQLLRGLGGGPIDRVKTVGAVQFGDHSFMPKRAPVDSTLNHAVLQHELGEAAEMTKPVVHPFATHLGPEPIVRENIALLGDPEAQRAMSRLRQLHPDDALVQRAVRQVGERPIPRSLSDSLELRIRGARR